MDNIACGKDLVIKDIRKTSTERIRIALRSYKGSEFLDIRNFYDSTGKETEFKPTSKGITVQLNLLPELRKAVEEAVECAESWSIKNDTE